MMNMVTVPTEKEIVPSMTYMTNRENGKRRCDLKLKLQQMFIEQNNAKCDFIICSE